MKTENKTENNTPWNEMEILDEWNFRLIFHTNGCENYVSEIWYRLDDEESFNDAGLRICTRHNWPDPEWLEEE